MALIKNSCLILIHKIPFVFGAKAYLVYYCYCFIFCCSCFYFCLLFGIISWLVRSLQITIRLWRQQCILISGWVDLRPHIVYRKKSAKEIQNLFHLTINLIKFYFAGRRYQSLQHWKKQPRSNIRLNFHQLYFLLANSNSSGFQELWRAGRNMHLNFNQLDGFNAHFNLWFPSFLKKKILFSTHLWARYFMMTK